MFENKINIDSRHLDPVAVYQVENIEYNKKNKDAQTSYNGYDVEHNMANK